jgi:hypothetical protein
LRACRVQVANARELEGSKGLLGVVNWASEKLLNAAHLRRSNTREGAWGSWHSGRVLVDSLMVAGSGGGGVKSHA